MNQQFKIAYNNIIIIIIFQDENCVMKTSSVEEKNIF